MPERILDIIVENSNQRLDAILYDNAEYRKIGREIDRGFQKLEKEKLTGKQNRALDRLLSAYNAENACCCRLLYRQGFKDCMTLLKEIGAA